MFYLKKSETRTCGKKDNFTCWRKAHTVISEVKK